MDYGLSMIILFAAMIFAVVAQSKVRSNFKRYSRIENGRRAVTDIEIDAISKILNVSLDYLFDRE